MNKIKTKYDIHKSQVKPGLEVPIFRNATEFKTPEGIAVLLEKIENGFPFIIEDVKEKSLSCITYKWDKWKIKFIEGPNKGFTTIRKIPYIWKYTQLGTSGHQGYKEYEYKKIKQHDNDEEKE